MDFSIINNSISTIWNTIWPVFILFILLYQGLSKIQAPIFNRRFKKVIIYNKKVERFLTNNNIGKSLYLYYFISLYIIIFLISNVILPLFNILPPNIIYKPQYILSDQIDKELFALLIYKYPLAKNISNAYYFAHSEILNSDLSDTYNVYSKIQIVFKTSIYILFLYSIYRSIKFKNIKIFFNMLGIVFLQIILLSLSSILMAVEYKQEVYRDIHEIKMNLMKIENIDEKRLQLIRSNIKEIEVLKQNHWWGINLGLVEVYHSLKYDFIIKSNDKTLIYDYIE